MHELSIAISLIDVATEEAERLDAPILALHLRLGVLSGVDQQALLAAYELAREGTPLSEAPLQIETVPITAWCATCRCDAPIRSAQEMECPFCRTPVTEVRSGRELELTGLEVPDDSTHAHRAGAPAGA